MPATITLKSLSYSTPDGRFLYQDLNLTFGACRTGLTDQYAEGAGSPAPFSGGDVPAAQEQRLISVPRLA